MIESTDAGSDCAAAAGPAAPRNVVAGLVLIGLALLALWLTADLPRGTLRAVGPAMLPQGIAVMIAVCGVALAIDGWLHRSQDDTPPVSLHGPLFVSLGVALFALTIKPMHFGSLATIELGLLVAGPLAIIVGGYASPHARLRDLVVLALCLTPFSMLLFGDLLNLPIPLIPRVLADALFADWSYKLSLRVTAAVLFACAATIYVLTRNHAPRPMDIASHDGSL
jgi:hypothetical protein